VVKDIHRPDGTVTDGLALYFSGYYTAPEFTVSKITGKGEKN
jgi:hypothetical protein